ncbi:MAG: sulfatase-like hydrolase/transferase, partial [Acidobacteriota bacterium]
MLLSVVLASCGGTPPPEPLSPSRPDLILIVIDALRRDHVGFHGQPAPTTPQLDRLAASGVVFDNAYAHAPQTFNSTAALLTSRYFPWLAEQQETGLAGAPPENRYFALASANRTLAEALKDAGYQTMAVLTNPHHWAGSGFWQGFEHPIYLTADSRAAAYARADRVHAAFLDWFDRALQPGPYFAYLHFMDVHNPYRAPRAIQRQFVTARGEDRYTNGLPREDAVPSAEDLVFM